MKVQKKDGSRERNLVTGMVVNTAVVAKIAPKWNRKRGPFRAQWPNIAGTLCVDYYDKYGKAPGKAMKGLVEKWAEDTADTTTVELLETFLAELSEDYVKLKREVNPQYLVDQAQDHFTKVRLERLRDEIDADLDAGRSAKALTRVRAFDDLNLGHKGGVDVLRDRSALKAAFEARSEPLIKLKGAAGNFFGDTLCRDGFIAFEGPEKRGKTTWQQEVCWQGILQRRKVALFEVGDESESDMILRFAARAAMKPLMPEKEVVKYPTYINPVGKGKEIELPEITYDERTFKHPLKYRDAEKALTRVVGKIGTDECLLKLFTFPNYTVSMRDVLSVLRDEERRGWVPDVVDVDYMDILAPPSATAEGNSRDQINANWMLARQLSQQYHCLFLTASQTKASSYDADTLDMSHFSEDKRKRGHSTGTVGINQTDDEKAAGVFRLNWLARRKGKFDKRIFLYCAGCMEIGNPMVLTTF